MKGPQRLLLIVCISVSACARSGAPTIDELSNATYSGIYDTPVRLEAGLYEGEPFQPGASSRPVVRQLKNLVAFADMNGDGVDEGIAVLVENSGGSGAFIYLAIVAREDGQAASLATTLIGDRVEVLRLEASSGRVSARVADRGVGSEPVDRDWDLVDGQLIERKIRFELDQLDESGLLGPDDGKRALSYEFCVPDLPDYLAEVARIDSSAQGQPGGRGRIGCGDGESLFVSDTHRPDFRTVLQQLAKLPYIRRIEQAFFE
jgi:hypothetical protein